eukprot:Lithocolla_globosa_v1_NODE_1829_length_2311_cov_5.136525.p3 type:complete len:138 gc:universal NODE_1829_length_2311_cov_5.136525:2071-1658(-)
MVCLGQITLIRTDDEGRLLVLTHHHHSCVKLLNFSEGRFVVDCIHKQKAFAGAEMLVSQTRILLLPGSIDNIQGSFVPFFECNLFLVVFLDGGVILMEKFILQKPDGDARFSYTTSTHNHYGMISQFCHDLWMKVRK